MNAATTMTLTPTTKRVKVAGAFGATRRVTGSGWVLFGRLPDARWFERRFPSEQAARSYAARRDWAVTAQKERLWL